MYSTHQWKGPALPASARRESRRVVGGELHWTGRAAAHHLVILGLSVVQLGAGHNSESGLVLMHGFLGRLNDRGRAAGCCVGGRQSCGRRPGKGMGLNQRVFRQFLKRQPRHHLWVVLHCSHQGILNGSPKTHLRCRPISPVHLRARASFAQPTRHTMDILISTCLIVSDCPIRMRSYV